MSDEAKVTKATDEPGSMARQALADDSERELAYIYPPAGKESETAQALLAATDNPADVRWEDGAFVVPSELAKKAKVPEGQPQAPVLSAEAQFATQTGGEQNAAGTDAKSVPVGRTPSKAPAKKAPAKKAPAKKATKATKAGDSKPSTTKD
jgi:hypothetical protein